eukprot:NODE_749_length_4226_cov_0.916404.p6 type:complete len:109 gc:universal NODE_749_length_4226_cov_0.916404:1739-1413(-)
MHQIESIDPQDSSNEHDILTSLVPTSMKSICLWTSNNLKCNRIFNNDAECFQHVRRDHQVRRLGICLWNNCYHQVKGSNNMGNHSKKHFNIIDAICLPCKVKFKWRYF